MDIEEEKHCFYFKTKELSVSDSTIIENEVKKQSKIIDLQNKGLETIIKNYPFTIKHKDIYTPDNENILKKLGYYILKK